MVRNSKRKLVNISSVAVLKPSASGQPLREDSPVDADNLGRGPYVWAKATAELAAVRLAKAGQLDLRTIRLGPLVDYDNLRAAWTTGAGGGALVRRNGEPPRLIEHLQRRHCGSGHSKLCRTI